MSLRLEVATRSGGEVVRILAELIDSFKRQASSPKPEA